MYNPAQQNTTGRARNIIRIDAEGKREDVARRHWRGLQVPSRFAEEGPVTAVMRRVFLNGGGKYAIEMQGPGSPPGETGAEEPPDGGRHECRA